MNEWQSDMSNISTKKNDDDSKDSKMMNIIRKNVCDKWCVCVCGKCSWWTR